MILLVTGTSQLKKLFLLKQANKVKLVVIEEQDWIYKVVSVFPEVFAIYSGKLCFGVGH